MFKKLLEYVNSQLGTVKLLACNNTLNLISVTSMVQSVI